MPVRAATFSLQDYPARPNFAGDRFAVPPGCGFHSTHAARGMASTTPANSWKCVANGV